MRRQASDRKTCSFLPLQYTNNAGKRIFERHHRPYTESSATKSSPPSPWKSTGAVTSGTIFYIRPSKVSVPRRSKLGSFLLPPSATVRRDEFHEGNSVTAISVSSSKEPRRPTSWVVYPVQNRCWVRLAQEQWNSHPQPLGVIALLPMSKWKLPKYQNQKLPANQSLFNN